MLMVFRYSARKHKRNNTYQFWTHESRAIEVYSNKFIEQKIEYIHNNPVVAGIVVSAEDYLYSSARNYAGLENLLEITEITFDWKTV